MKLNESRRETVDGKEIIRRIIMQKCVSVCVGWDRFNSLLETKGKCAGN